MPLDKTIRKTLVIGSGPIVIGQAAEFDYAGHAGACRVLKEAGRKRRARQLQSRDHHDRPRVQRMKSTSSR